MNSQNLNFLYKEEMFNSTEILIDAFAVELRKGYRRMYGGLKSDYEEIICWASSMALENIANSDALYHNVEHTILVTLVGQEIFRGVHVKRGGVTPEDWLLSVISLLCHDIGFVRGVCRLDNAPEGLFATGIENETVHLSKNASDASLNPYHVNRGKMFVRERFGKHKLIDAETICRNIELTSFPVPDKKDSEETKTFPGLIRAADLIGQLSDPRYLKKIVALYWEFEEIGVNKKFGFKSPEELRSNYPRFYWESTHQYIKDALRYLSLSQFGKQIIANLYSHIFVVEHKMVDFGEFQIEAPFFE